MSYGGYRLSRTIFTALEALAKSGIVIVGAAGNERRNFSAEPASSPYVISVGSIDKRNSISYFSNRGTGVDIYAAGQDVILANGLNQTSTQIWNGTSFSSPLVAGICANIMQDKPKPRSWDDVLNVRKQILNSTMRINPSILKNIIFSQSLDLSNENIDNIDDVVETDEFIDNFDDNSKYQYEDDNRDVHPCNECCDCDDNNDLTYLYFILFVVILIALVFLYFHQRNKNVRGLTNIRNVKNNIMY
jgi:subtilisin family serine protease